MSNEQTEALPEGMVPWAGGDAAPDDWNGGPVHYANGITAQPLDDGDWRRPADIPLIGYTPKRATPSPAPSDTLAKIEPMAAAHLGYAAGFGDARFMAKQLVFQVHGICELTSAIEAIAPIDSSEFDGAEVYLAAALDQIDGEAPASEPRDGPTVGFPPSRDPEQDDGSEVVREAFDEGVARGLWLAAQIARSAIAKHISGGSHD